jgi:hypothetical protein
VEAVIRLSYPVAGFSRFQPELTVTTTGYNDRITGSHFLPFSGIFPLEMKTFPRVPAENLRNRRPELFSWILSQLINENNQFKKRK